LQQFQLVQNNRNIYYNYVCCSVSESFNQWKHKYNIINTPVVDNINGVPIPTPTFMPRDVRNRHGQPSYEPSYLTFFNAKTADSAVINVLDRQILSCPNTVVSPIDRKTDKAGGVLAGFKLRSSDNEGFILDGTKSIYYDIKCAITFDRFLSYSKTVARKTPTVPLGSLSSLSQLDVTCIPDRGLLTMVQFITEDGSSKMRYDYLCI
jgi:hypothetical protein